MISIGAVYNGPELQGSQINRLIMAVSKAVKELRGTLGKTPWVNAVFVVPGSLGDGDVDHLMYGDYSKKDHAVVVQIPVPRSIAEGGDQVAFIVDGLHGANAMAFEFFRQRGENFPLREAEALVGKVAERIAV
jgi:hypothetical protein